MTLRTRLLLGLVATLGVFAIGVIYTIASQRAHLLDQVDDLHRGTSMPDEDPAGLYVIECIPNPDALVPADTPEEFTEVIYDDLTFDVDIPASVFTLQALKR